MPRTKKSLFLLCVTLPLSGLCGELLLTFLPNSLLSLDSLQCWAFLRILMKKLFTLALVGRPNVGKSSLFNRICRKRISIVDSKPGVTRDRIYGKADLFGMPFDVIDTGGIDPKSDMPFNEKILLQAEIAMQEADTIVMVADAKEGPTALDAEIVRLLRKTNKPLVLAVNKVDGPSCGEGLYAFHSLGMPKIVPVSAAQGSSIAELLEAAFEGFVWDEEEEERDEGIKVAIVGRPNVGKSTLLNFLLHEDRSIVSDIPGTTRDPIDATLQIAGKTYTLVDTAGIRKKKSEKDVIDKFAFIRTQSAIEKCDVCLLVVDARYGLSTEEKRIASYLEEEKKSCILLLNKWDLVKGFRMEHATRAIREEAPFLEHCPMIPISALTGRNLEKLFPTILQVHEQRYQKLTTPELNKFIEGCLQRYHPPQISGKRLRIYYMTQTEDSPPRFIIFVNYRELMTDTYKKYLINQFREKYGFSGCPISFDLRGKGAEREAALS